MSSSPLPPASPSGGTRRVSANELAATIHARDGAAFFVEPRVLRRVIKLDRDINTLGMQVPHASCYAISRSLLWEFVERDELFPAPSPPERVILLPLPEADELAQYTADELLAQYTRLLFHARLHLALEQRLASGQLGAAAVRERICRLGQTEFEEARAVLRAEDLLLPPRDDLQVYIELAATFLELERFAPQLLPQFFPAIADRQAAAAIFQGDVAHDELLTALGRHNALPEPTLSEVLGRGVTVLPPIADDPTGPSSRDTSCAVGATAYGTQSVPATPTGRPSLKQRRLLRHAEQTEDVGNLVRGAILRVRAAKAAKSPPGQSAIDDELYDLSRLAARLQQALGFDDAERDLWDHLLGRLLRLCADDRLTIEGRLLYDLQKVCVDHEREIFTIDLTEWLLSAGRQPIRRPLPALREVLTCKHLRTALRRLHDARLTEPERARLAGLLEHALHHAEEAARGHLRPGIAEALRVGGIVPSNVPEEVSRHKIVEELLDKAVESGYLRFGDLRDAISRNNLKLPDLVSLATPRELAQGARQKAAEAKRWSGLLWPLIYFWRWLKHLLFGDHLLRADRQLADRLDGVYHRAEIYLRLFQRITSLGFGSGVGRLLNRFLILPLLGAFLVVSFYQEMAHLTRLDHLIPSGELIEALGTWFGEGPRAAAESHPGSVAWFLAFGLFFLGLINSAAVRRGTARLLKLTIRALSTVIERFIHWLARPLMQAILYNPWIVLARRYLLKPLLATALIWLVLIVFEREVTPWSLAGIFLALNFLLNSRVGRNAEEIGNDWLSRAWLNVRARVASGFYWLIVDLSKAFLEGADRLLYAADEWLRFRRGESWLSFTVKAILGVVWFAVTYVVRFGINLLLEPQINPIKHFPVVTVSHKVLLPMTVSVEWGTVPSPLGLVLVKLFGLDPGLANSIAFAVVWGIPGIFGFLAWELKENWKLYAANRATVLRPAPIGHHGETMVRLLRPGFHSGTVPKLFRKVRRAHRKARRTGQGVAELARRPLGQLHHVRHALAHYVEREFVYLLRQCPTWPHKLALGEISLATNRIRIELRCDELSPEPCWLSFEDQRSWLLAGLTPGWITRLPAAQRQILRDAFLGLYKTSGVELVRQQLDRFWAGEIASYRMAEDDHLALWPNDPRAPEITYHLDGEGRIEPRSTAEVPAAFTLMDADELLLSLRPIRWADWVATWDRHASGQAGAPLLEYVTMLPEQPPNAETPGAWTATSTTDHADRAAEI